MKIYCTNKYTYTPKHNILIVQIKFTKNNQPYNQRDKYIYIPKTQPLPDNDLLLKYTHKNPLAIRFNLHHEGILSPSRRRNIFLGSEFYLHKQASL